MNNAAADPDALVETIEEENSEEDSTSTDFKKTKNQSPAPRSLRLTAVDRELGGQPDYHILHRILHPEEYNNFGYADRTCLRFD